MASGGAASCVNHAPCPSLLFPLGYFEREVIERVEIVWGVRQIAVSLEILELDFNLDEFPPFTERVRSALISTMGPFLKGSGRVCQRTPEGVVIVLGQGCAIEDSLRT